MHILYDGLSSPKISTVELKVLGRVQMRIASGLDWLGGVWQKMNTWANKMPASSQSQKCCWSTDLSVCF